jgi:uncharacterized membrane protein
MRRIILAAALVAASVSYAFADDVMASRYGNTTIATDAKGVQTKVYYKADGTLTAKQADKDYSGTWKVVNGQVCLTFKEAPPGGMANPFCAQVMAHKVGDTWKSGERTITLVQGIQ